MVRPWQFHITAGVLCLDFANTLSWRRSATPIERLATFDDLASWARQAGLISKIDEQRLRREAAVHPPRARRMLREARLLREAIFAVAAAVSERRRPAASEVAPLERWVQQAVVHSRLAGRERNYRWEPPAPTDRTRWILWRIALSAHALLTSADADRIGQCSGRDCRWLWVDRTRNKSRRWCDMAVCGNRAKARRHYQRRAAMA